MSHSTGLTITNPLVLYRTLLATNRIRADPAQHRLAVHLQKLYYRLKDYQPQVDFRHRLNQIDQIVRKPEVFSCDHDNVPPIHEPKRRNSFFKFEPFREDYRSNQSKALTRSLTDHESAIDLNSPQGLLLYGEVGTGKSLLIDLLADSLPTINKRRWHFNTFMLEIFAKLEQLRRSRQQLSPSQAVNTISSEEPSLLWLARDMISTSPILFLDEFQLPDRAASKILTNLFTSFFQLGGVLVATSNRMPEELARASGTESGTPPSTRLGLFSKRWKTPSASSGKGATEDVFTGNRDFAVFLDVLRARCEIWEMEGDKDWRRHEAAELTSEQHIKNQNAVNLDGFQGLEPMTSGNLGLGYEQSLEVDPQSGSLSTKPRPKHYFIRQSDTPDQIYKGELGQAWRLSEVSTVHGSGCSQHPLEDQIPWESTALRVYGHDLQVPRHLKGVSKWTFVELCSCNFGPADYVTLASTFHTFILTGVPILTMLHKNEARRLITLLDALYEARCKLLFSAEAGPDGLFFPVESRQAFSAVKKTAQLAESPTSGARKLPRSSQADDSVYSETISEIYQDVTSPFRPNTSSYSSSASPPSYAASAFPTSAPQLSKARSILADEDSDFGPVYGAGRRHGVSDGSPGAGNEIGRQVDFGDTGSFVGEDEKFAYKRARSRLWEMCGARWWEREGDWWKPLAREARSWEGDSHDAMPSRSSPDQSGLERQTGNEHLFRYGASPFRTSEAAPPRFSWVHSWGMMSWGKKAGDWGKGPAGLGNRKMKDAKTDKG